MNQKRGQGWPIIKKHYFFFHFLETKIQLAISRTTYISHLQAVEALLNRAKTTIVPVQKAISLFSDKGFAGERHSQEEVDENDDAWKVKQVSREEPSFSGLGRVVSKIIILRTNC